MKFYCFFLIIVFSVNITFCQDSNPIDSFTNSIGFKKDSLSNKNLPSIKKYLHNFENHNYLVYAYTNYLSPKN